MLRRWLEQMSRHVHKQNMQSIKNATHEYSILLSYMLRFGGTAFCLLQVVDTIKCVGPSMLPTLNRDGDILLVDKFTPRFQPYKPGEVVIAKSISNPRNIVCKRVIGMVGTMQLCWGY